MPCSRSIPPLLYGEEARPAYNPNALPLAKRRTNASRSTQYGCALNADATQRGKLLDHLTSFIGRLCFHYRITLALQLSDLREHQFQPSKQTLDLGMCVCR